MQLPIKDTKGRTRTSTSTFSIDVMITEYSIVVRCQMDVCEPGGLTFGPPPVFGLLASPLDLNAAILNVHPLFADVDDGPSSKSTGRDTRSDILTLCHDFPVNVDRCCWYKSTNDFDVCKVCLSLSFNTRVGSNIPATAMLI